MTTYNLKSLNLPRLSGTGLSLLRAGLEKGLTRSILAPSLLRNTGITKLRKKAIAEAPTFYPSPPGLNIDENGNHPASEILGEKTLERTGLGFPFSRVRDYAVAYRAGMTDPLNVARRFLGEWEKSDQGKKPLRAFIAVNREDLLNQAEEATERVRTGKPLSILDGVPVAVKDEIDQRPYPTTVGTGILGKNGATEDGTVVARLRKLGAMLVGKTNMHEIGINPTGYNRRYGIARNPYEKDRDTGGSSSGSAGAVAAGLCPVAIGADGGGSIRIPAALCGLVGLKPTFARVSEKGAAPLCWSVAHIGPIGCSVEDVAILYAAIAGPDKEDPLTLLQPEPLLPFFDRLPDRPLRIGYYPEWFEHAEEDIVTVCRGTLERLGKENMKIERIEIEELDETRIAHAIIILSEMNSSMIAQNVDVGKLADLVRVNLAIAKEFSTFDYLQAQRMRTRAIEIWTKIFDKVDLVASPATAITAPPIPKHALSGGCSDLAMVTELMRYAFPANLTGMPAITVPVGYTENNLPIGLQLTANYWREDLLFTVAKIIESSIEHRLPIIHHRLI